MLSLVEKLRGSGQTLQEFCSFDGIKLHTLSYWIGVSKEEKVPSGFIEVLPTNDTIQKIEVIYPNGVKVNAGVDLNLVSKLIHLY
ncbi:IS66 family insertion sequence element accessory protein TnpA [Sphingobacterium sp. SG20118]|uniref:IS66 family insertion sequence element accessory protein TnpA n=1 Tax=Sphingobacterium sp. SG20118 TaxID=3367156 RepID=UPI0037DFC06A